MRLKNLLLNNVYSFGEGTQCTFQYEGDAVRMLIVGRNLDDPGSDSNGAGKSNILNSIFWLIFGEVFQEENVDAIIRQGQSWCSGSVALVDNDHTLSISRGRGAGKRKFLTLTYDGEDKTALTDEQTQAEILKYLQISNKLKASEYITDFVNTVYFSSDVTKGFMGKKTSSKERFMLVERFLSLKRYTSASEQAKNKRTEITNKAETLAATIQSKEEYLKANPEQGAKDSLVALQDYMLRIQKQMLDLSSRIMANNDRQMAKSTLEQKQQTMTALKESFKAQFDALELEYANNARIQIDQQTKIELYVKTAKDVETKNAEEKTATEDNKTLVLQIQQVETNTQTLNQKAAVSDAEIKQVRNQLANHLTCPQCNTAVMLQDNTLLHVDIDALSKELAQLEQGRGVIVQEVNTNKEALTKLRERNTGNNMTISAAVSARSALAVLQPLETLQQEITRLVARNAEIGKSFETISTNAQTQIGELKTAIAALEQQLLTLGDPSFNAQQATVDMDGLKDQEAQTNKQIGQYEEHLRNLDTLKKEVADTNILLMEERRQAEMYGFWELGFRQLKLDIIDQFLPDFEVLVNSYLERLKVNLRVSFDTQKEKAKVSKKDRLEGRAFKEEFNVEVFKDGKEPLPYGLMSKGQRGRIGSCVGMALRELTKERGNNVFDFFFLDEIADALDESGLRELIGLLDTLPGQKLIISHNDFLKDFFEDRIIVEIENDISTIRVTE